MFFETTDISILDLSTVENISYNFFRSGRANGRRFHSLSFRIDTDVVLETEHGKVWTKPGDIVFMPAFCGYSVAGNKDKFIVVHFDEFNTPEEAIKYQNYIIRMNSEEVHRLPKDTYYYKDLIGSTVYLENGNKYGEVISVTNNGKQDLLRIKMVNNKETLIVFVNALIKEVDIKNKSIILNDIEGL